MPHKCPVYPFATIGCHLVLTTIESGHFTPARWRAASWPVLLAGTVHHLLRQVRISFLGISTKTMSFAMRIIDQNVTWCCSNHFPAGMWSYIMRPVARHAVQWHRLDALRGCQKAVHDPSAVFWQGCSERQWPPRRRMWRFRPRMSPPRRQVHKPPAGLHITRRTAASTTLGPPGRCGFADDHALPLGMAQMLRRL